MHAPQHIYRGSHHISSGTQTCDGTFSTWEGMRMLVRCGVNEILPAVDVVETCFRRLCERARTCMPHDAWRGVCADAVAAMVYDAPCKVHRAGLTELELPLVRLKSEVERTLRSMMAVDAAQPLAAEVQDSQVRTSSCKPRVQADVSDDALSRCIDVEDFHEALHKQRRRA
jgi:hypothetical protein